VFCRARHLTFGNLYLYLFLRKRHHTFLHSLQTFNIGENGIKLMLIAQILKTHLMKAVPCEIRK